MLDLYNNKYDRQTLKENIYDLNLIDILKTQKLDESFVVKYIMNKNYQLTEEEQKINIKTIVSFQKHLSYISLYNKFLEYISDDDSIDDFEVVSKQKR
jgi:hypothetical protein